jgi:hypothetical protein
MGDGQEGFKADREMAPAHASRVVMATAPSGGRKNLTGREFYILRLAWV